MAANNVMLDNADSLIVIAKTRDVARKFAIRAHVFMSEEHAAKIQQFRAEKKEWLKRARELDKDRKHQASTNLRLRKHAAYNPALEHAKACKRNAGVIKRAHDKRQDDKR